MDTRSPALTAAPQNMAERVAVPVLAAVSVSHLLNDLIQSLLPAIYPILKESFRLDFAQIGLLTLTFQITASLLQPLVGLLHRQAGRARSPWWSAWASRSIGLLTLSQAAYLSRCCSWARPWWAWGRPCSIRNPPGWPGWRRAGGMGWPSRCSRSAATPARPSGRCWRPSSSCPWGSPASPGSRSSPCWRWSSSSTWGAGIRRGSSP